MDRPGRTKRYWADSSVYGNVIGGCWGIFLETQNPFELHCAASGFSMENAIDAQYLRLEQTDAEDPDGLGETYTIPYSVGGVREISTLTHHHERRVLGRQIQLAAPRLGDIWRRELHLPNFASTEIPPTLGDQIVIFGGRGRWSLLGNHDMAG